MSILDTAWKIDKAEAERLIAELNGSLRSLRGGWMEATYPSRWKPHLPIVRKKHGWRTMAEYLAMVLDRRAEATSLEDNRCELS